MLGLRKPKPRFLSWGSPPTKWHLTVCGWRRAEEAQSLGLRTSSGLAPAVGVCPVIGPGLSFLICRLRG